LGIAHVSLDPELKPDLLIAFADCLAQSQEPLQIDVAVQR